MKKIKNLEQLQHEKLKLQVDEFKLKQAIRDDFKDIKATIQHPVEFGTGKHWVSSGLRTVSSFITNSILEKIQDRITFGKEEHSCNGCSSHK